MESGLGRGKLLCKEQINSKVLLPSTGSYMQCPAINRNGREHEKERKSVCVCVCVCVCCCCCCSAAKLCLTL